MLECDVFVTGCGPAGASLAWYLAQKNIKVIVAEKKKNLDRPVRCAEFVPVNIAGLFDFRIGGINNRIEYLETYAAENPTEKFQLISKTAAPGFILDRDTFINDIASRFTKAGGKLLKGTKVVSVHQSADGFIVDLLDIPSKNHLMVRARIIAGADGPLSLIGRLAGSANKSFVPAIQQNPSIILKSADCSKVFFSPYISCGYGWLFPKTESVNLGVGTFLGRKIIQPEHKADISKKSLFAVSGNWNGGKDFDNWSFGRNSGDFDNYRFGRNSSDSSLDKDSGYRGLGRDAKRAGMPLKNILDAFIRHLELSGILTGNIKQDKSLETCRQPAPAVTGLIPDSGIVENPGSKDGLILCGDAAGLCNPITGAGIYNAIYSARLASESIVKSLSLNDLNILQEIKEIYNSQFGNSINRALRKKLMQKNNWPEPVQDLPNRCGYDFRDNMKFSDLVRQTWVSFKDYWD